MVAENGASQEKQEDSDRGRYRKSAEPERGCYSQALREGRVRRPPPNASRITNAFLRAFNMVGWLLLAAFVAWRIYVFYIA